MDFEPEGQGESLISSAQEKTAQRTHYLLVASRLVFVFAHGLLLVCGSLHLSAKSRHDPHDADAAASWWLVFLPVWLGDSICLGLVISSWFASCPYIRLCLAERQARLGEANPSILTELLPDIVMAVPGLIFMILALVAEILLCRYLDRKQNGEDGTLMPSMIIFILLASFACCRGICIRTDGEMFVILGAGILVTSVAALRVPGDMFGADAWILVLPALFSAAGFLLAVFLRSRNRREVLNPQERFLRIAEQIFAAALVIALTALAVALAPTKALADPGAATAPALGTAVGGSLCIIAVLRVQMEIVESRSTLIRDRLTAWAALRCNQSARVIAPSQEAMAPIAIDGRPGPTAAGHHGVSAGDQRVSRDALGGV